MLILVKDGRPKLGRLLPLQKLVGRSVVIVCPQITKVSYGHNLVVDQPIDDETSKMMDF